MLVKLKHLWVVILVLALVSATVASIGIVAADNANDGEYTACIQKNNGMLRIVDGCDDCRKSEVCIPLNAGGADGINCWDLNGNGHCDLADEDVIPDGECNALDCIGPQGAEGPKGEEGECDCGPGFGILFGAILELNARVAALEQEGDPCDDGNPCTENDHYVDGLCVGEPGPNGTPCDGGDGNLCNSTCSSGVCDDSIPVDCDDGNVCTDDSCDPNTGDCESTPVGGFPIPTCDDGDPCTLFDMCHADGYCTGQPASCGPAGAPSDGCCQPGCTNPPDIDCPPED